METKANKFTGINIDLNEGKYNKTTTKLLMYIALTNCYGCPKSEDDIELFINNFSGIIGNKGGTSWIAEDAFDEFWMLVYEDAISKFRNAEINYGKFFFKQLKEDTQSTSRKIREYTGIDRKSDSKIPGEIREYIKNFELSAKFKAEYESYIKGIEDKQKEIYNKINQTCENTESESIDNKSIESESVESESVESESVANESIDNKSIESESVANESIDNENKIDLPLYLEIMLIHREDIPCGLKLNTVDKKIYPFNITVKNFIQKYKLDKKEIEFIYCKVSGNWEPISKVFGLMK